MIDEKKLIEALDLGLSIDTSTPYDVLAKKINCTTTEVIEAISKLIDDGKIKRFGIVIKNRSIGFVHNAMVTIDVPDDQVDTLGQNISKYPFIKLCYQRKRIIPEWNFNLYFMVHGKDRDLVLKQIEQVLIENKLTERNVEILFSKQCLKQKGASYH